MVSFRIYIIVNVDMCISTYMPANNTNFRTLPCLYNHIQPNTKTSHYNAVKYFMELKDRRVRPFGYTMATGIIGTALVFIAMMIFGFGTFGANTQALLLNNYHNAEDHMANIARFFTGLAIISVSSSCMYVRYELNVISYNKNAVGRIFVLPNLFHFHFGWAIGISTNVCRA